MILNRQQYDKALDRLGQIMVNYSLSPREERVFDLLVFDIDEYERRVNRYRFEEEMEYIQKKLKYSLTKFSKYG